MVCPHGQGGRGLSQFGHFLERGEGQFFAILCGRLLRTAPYYKSAFDRHLYYKIRKCYASKLGTC